MLNSEKLKKRKTAVKSIWIILITISTIITILLIAINSINTNSLLALMLMWDMPCFLFGIFSLIGVKFETYLYNKHEISFYLGWGIAYLLIDDTIVDKHTGSYIGSSPLKGDLNGETVLLKIGFLTLNNYTLSIGNKIFH